LKSEPLIKNNLLQGDATMISLLQSQQPKPISQKPTNNIKIVIHDPSLMLVDVNPEFKGGYPEMLNCIQRNIHYPEKAYKERVQGTVFVQFLVEKTGKISNIKILRGIGSGCDEEAIRVMKSMPDWNPARNKGKAVSVIFQIPVKFQLKKEKKEGRTILSEYPITAKDMEDGTLLQEPSNSIQTIDKNDPLYVVDQEPKYKGGYKTMLKYLHSNLKYPPKSRKKGIEGDVFVQFIVNKTGKVSDVKILRGIENECDKEAIRVVKLMPDWIPGKQHGKIVRVFFQIPVKFDLATTRK